MPTKSLGSAGGGLFWTFTAIACGLIAGGVFGYVIAFFGDAAPSSGLMIGAVIFVAVSWVLATFAMGGPLPPPNSLPVPTAPPGGRYTVPGGAPTGHRHETQPVSAHDLGVSVGETVASVRAKLSEAAQSVGDRVSGLTGTGSDEREADTHDREAAEAPRPAPAPEPAAEAADGYTPAYPVGEPLTAGEAGAAAAETEVEPHEPPRFDAPREGEADDLKRISGVGPALEAKLNDLGIYHYAQIAAWTRPEIAWIDTRLDFAGRVVRDEWVEQAARLAAGDEPDPAALGSGE